MDKDQDPRRPGMGKSNSRFRMWAFHFRALGFDAPEIYYQVEVSNKEVVERSMHDFYREFQRNDAGTSREVFNVEPALAKAKLIELAQSFQVAL